MEGFIELIIGMWIVAIVSFAPLGYFIYIFTKGDGHTFGKSDPDSHKVEDGKYYNLINNVMQKILGGTGTTSSSNNGETPPAKRSNSNTAAVVSNTESTTESAPKVVSRGYGSAPAKR